MNSRSVRRRLMALLMAVALLAAPASAQPPSGLRKLAGVAELKSWFNANRGHPRAIFLLSPT